MAETIPEKETQCYEVAVQPARPEDAEALAGILTSGVISKVARGDMAWGENPFSTIKALERIAKGNTYIGRIGQTPVGTFSIDAEDTLVWGQQPSNAAYVHQLAVNDKYRGMNLGKQLLDLASQEVARMGKTLLRLDVPAENEGLKSYYESQGFTWVENRVVSTGRGDYTAALYERPVI